MTDTGHPTWHLKILQAHESNGYISKQGLVLLALEHQHVNYVNFPSK